MIEHDGCVGCKYEHEDEASPHCDKCTQNSTDKYMPVSNADRIRGMSDEELAELLSQIAYARYTPWAEPFSRTFCDDCPVTTVKLLGYCHEMDLHECDFTDGECPYGSDIVYWLQQPCGGVEND